MVNKLTLPAKENAVQNKINEVIDALGTATGANTDLSNLSATGESHFQEPLISGTNIKSINSISLLGSGNIDTNEIFVAEYGTTSYADILSAYNNGKVIFVYQQGLNYYATLFRYNNVSSPNRFWFSHCVDNSIINFICENNGTNEWSSTTIDLANTDLSNLSATGNLKLCGNFVSKDQNVISSTSLNGSSNLDKKSVLEAYLPDDDYTYLVLVVADCDTGTSTGNYFKLSINAGANIVRICQARTRSNSSVMAGGGVWIPVGGTRKFEIVRNSNFNGTATVDLKGYWRIM